MQTLFREEGKFSWLKDASGNVVSGFWAKGFSVVADVQYQLKPHPEQSLWANVYGVGFSGAGATRNRLTLANGVVLTGRGFGGSLGENWSTNEKISLYDIEETLVTLPPTEDGVPSPKVDAVVLGVIASTPLGSAACSNGVARPGYPFSFIPNFPEDPKSTWSSHALRIYLDNLEITFVQSSKYWRRLVDSRLRCDSIVGVRRCDKTGLDWDEINLTTTLISKFLGWVNHCAAPIFHIKGYRKGKVVYRGYNVNPYATVPRDTFSWLPEFPVEGEPEAHAHLVEDLLRRFAAKWQRNWEEKGVFHIALQFLRSPLKGPPRQGPSVGYLRDTFTACAILSRMLDTDAKDNMKRIEVMQRCLQQLCVVDKLPIDNSHDQHNFAERYSDLWRKRGKNGKLGDVQETAHQRCTLSHPITNMMNWLLHLDEAPNAEMLLDMPNAIQKYLVDVSVWLSDLMVLKTIGYQGLYFSRLTQQTEQVPWSK